MEDDLLKHLYDVREASNAIRRERASSPALPLPPHPFSTKSVATTNRYLLTCPQAPCPLRLC